MHEFSLVKKEVERIKDKVNGKKVSGTKKVIHVSPNNSDITLGYIQQASSEQVKRAIKSASLAFKIWGEIGYRNRIRIFKKIVELVRSRKFELAAWLSFENGKNRYEAIADVDEAIDHIMTYGSHHSDAIVTSDYERGHKFLREVDSAAVYVNASTRFTDGNEFGLGAELGISTQKLHSRGPMGLEDLTSQKYIIFGNGQIRG